MNVALQKINSVTTDGLVRIYSCGRGTHAFALQTEMDLEQLRLNDVDHFVNFLQSWQRECFEKVIEENSDYLSKVCGQVLYITGMLEELFEPLLAYYDNYVHGKQLIVEFNDDIAYRCHTPGGMNVPSEIVSLLFIDRNIQTTKNTMRDAANKINHQILN